MGWQTTVAVQLQAGDTIINPSGAFTYSAAPAAGDLVASITPASGTDSFGNHYLEGVTSYGTTTATQVDQGFISFYTGSLAAGWTLRATQQFTVVGIVLLSGGLETAFNTLDDGAGNASISGALSVTGNLGVSTINGSSNTGTTGLPDGTIHGTSGPASTGTAHTHSPGSFAVGNGQHAHAI